MKDCRIRGCRCEEGGDLVQIAVPLGGGLLLTGPPPPPTAQKRQIQPVQEPIENLVARVNQRCPRQSGSETIFGKSLNT